MWILSQNSRANPRKLRNVIALEIDILKRLLIQFLYVYISSLLWFKRNLSYSMINDRVRNGNALARARTNRGITDLYFHNPQRPPGSR